MDDLTDFDKKLLKSSRDVDNKLDVAGVAMLSVGALSAVLAVIALVQDLSEGVPFGPSFSTFNRLAGAALVFSLLGSQLRFRYKVCLLLQKLAPQATK
jgi:hypothetical protein